MGRKVKDYKLDTRTSRLKLKPRGGKPYFTRVGPETHLGYRALEEHRRRVDGTWTVRRPVKNRPSNPYTYEVVGRADDVSDSNGVTVLTFDQAVDIARQRMNSAVVKKAAPFTVADAVKLYLTDTEKKGRSRDVLADTRGKLERFVLPALGVVPLEELTTEQISDWLLDLVASRPQTRSGAVRKTWEGTEDQKRARRATAARLWTSFRAALNHSFKKGKVSSDVAWKRVDAPKDVSKARDRALTVAECRRLINGSDPEFKPMMQAGVLTGSRYGSLADLRIKDFDPAAGTLQLTHRKGSAGTKVYYCHLTAEGRAFFLAACAGRKREDLIFTRNDGAAWNKSNQQKFMAAACRRAGIDPPITFYALRHSWISLAVMAGMTFADVAANVGTGVAMIEKHYAHLAPSHRARQVTAFAPTFGIDPGNIAALP